MQGDGVAELEGEGGGLMRRTPLQRKSRLRQRRKEPRRESRERDPDYLDVVGGLPCILHGVEGAGTCRGRVDPDHVGERAGIGVKADDNTAVPLCRGHHDDRHDMRGYFKGWTREQMRKWKKLAIGQTTLAVAAKRASRPVDQVAGPSTLAAAAIRSITRAEPFLVEVTEDPITMEPVAVVVPVVMAPPPDPEDDRLDALYWRFDALRRGGRDQDGLGDRGAFKAVLREALEALGKGAA